MDLRVSQARDMFYDLLKIILASEIKDDEDAIFIKQLIDYVIRIVDDCRVKGLEQRMIPICYASIWQSATKEGLFSLRAQAGISSTDDNNITDLVQKLKDAFYLWGDETLDGVVILDETD